MKGDNDNVALKALAQMLVQVEVERARELSEHEIWRFKLEACRELGLSRVPNNSKILSLMANGSKKRFQSRLRRKSIRTRSGIAVVTAITKPFDCPHGTCTFCPGGVRFGTPQSYTRKSPAAAFGLARDFDPARQISDSLAQLSANGHDTSKIELILLGGTILAMPQEYQVDFVKNSYEALNGVPSPNLQSAITQNETSRHRCVGFTIETKPDWCRAEHIDMLLSYAATRVEIGVQSLRDEVLKMTNRGHTLEDTVRAFGLARDAGFKIVAHMMPGLPGSDPEKDLEDLTRVVTDERFKPDMLKIYPTVVVEGTALHNLWRIGRFTPYDTEAVVDILCRFKRQVPDWLRIMRIQREIPKEEVATGPGGSGNLRQLVSDEMRKRGYSCRCIRCREVGRQSPDHPTRGASGGSRSVKLRRLDYKASFGHEVFLSFEEECDGPLHGFLRLRIPSGSEHRPEILDQGASIVRELHVYGQVVPVGAKSADPRESQHRGLGTALLLEAESISRNEFGRRKQIVISASGTREYYMKRGYKDDGAYVSKYLG